jgi:hypothetical protein
MTMVRNCRLSEGALRQLHLPLLLLENNQHLADVVKMFFIRAAVNENVVEEDESEFTQYWS